MLKIIKKLKEKNIIKEEDTIKRDKTALKRTEQNLESSNNMKN